LSHFVPYPPAGGALQRAFHLLKHAAERHELHLLALHQPRLLPPSELPGSIDVLSRLCASVQVFPLFAERSKLHRLAAMARSVVDTSPFDVVWLRSTRMRAAVASAVAQRRPDLVHVDTIGLWPYAEVPRRAGLPTVLSHHNVESDLARRRAGRENASWRASILRRDADKLYALERSAAPLATVNTVVSRLDRERLETIAPGAAVEVVDNGVDVNYWAPDGAAEVPGSLIFAGTLGWGPNREAVDFLLAEIWPLLSMRRADRRLTLVGRDAGAAAVAAAAADARVVVTGFVPDVRPYLRTASIYICPIRVGGGTRLKVLDALAMAKPLVATAVAVEGLDVIDGTHYLQAETPAQFAAQVERLERSPELRARLGANGRRLAVERYSWSVVGGQLDAAYARAVGSAAKTTRSPS
jgi:glycosyltransferase involved in cell wall biosynthesis